MQFRRAARTAGTRDESSNGCCGHIFHCPQRSCRFSDWAQSAPDYLHRVCRRFARNNSNGKYHSDLPVRFSSSNAQPAPLGLFLISSPRARLPPTTPPAGEVMVQEAFWKRCEMGPRRPQINYWSGDGKLGADVYKQDTGRDVCRSDEGWFSVGSDTFTRRRSPNQKRQSATYGRRPVQRELSPQDIPV